MVGLRGRGGVKLYSFLRLMIRKFFVILMVSQMIRGHYVWISLDVDNNPCLVEVDAGRCCKLLLPECSDTVECWRLLEMVNCV